MPDVLVVSNVLLWLVVIVLAVAVLALARQIGVLHERIRPVGALSLGQAVQAGDDAPAFTLESLTGGVVSIGGRKPDDRDQLLLFLSPTCPVCKTVLPIARELAAGESTQLVLASDGWAQEHEAFIAAHRLEDLPYVLSGALGMAYRIGKLPYAVLVGAGGKVLAHGLVNNREHLESLFEARRLGVPDVQAAARAAAAGA